MRTIPNISTLLRRLDKAVDDFLKVLFDNHEFNSVERNLWSLPVRLGGLGVPIPSQISDEQYEHSRLINEKLTAKVIGQEKIYEDINMEVNKVKSTIKAKKDERHQNLLTEITTQMADDEEKLKALEASQEKGASSWLNALPLKSQGFLLDKQSFRVAIYTRYGIPHKRLPSHCVCGTKFTVEHALNCKKGGFITSRHNDLRRITADFLKEVCLDVEEEPLLQEITGEVFQAKTAKTEKEARLDVAARGFWMRGQKLYCDIRVFNPLAKCYRKNSLAKIHEKHEKEKKIKYAKRVIEVEHGSFTPLVFSCFGGMSRECGAFFKHLAEKLAEKRNITTSEATCFLRTKLSFSLVKSLVLCICGSRSVRDNPSCTIGETDICLTNVEGQLRQS